MLSSLRARLTLSSVGISFAVLLLLFVVSYVSLERFLETSNAATTRHNLQIAMDVLDHEIATLRQMMSWFSVNGPLQDFVASPRENEEAERRKKLAAYEVLRSALYGNTLYASMNKLIIVDRHGRSIQMGSVPGHWSDAEVARKTMAQGPERLMRDPFHYATGNQVIVLSKPVFQEYTGEEAAWIQVALNTDMLTKYLSEYSFEQKSQVFFVLGDAVLVMGDQRKFEPSDVPASVFRDPEAASADSGGIRLGLRGRTELMVTYQAKGSGWILAQSVPTAQLDRQNLIFVRLAAFVGLAMVLLVGLLLVLVDRAVNRPIVRIQHRLADIARGDFGTDPSLEFRNELGDIGRGINAMSKNIGELLASRIDDERAKKNLEFKMLQSQINPHFLYNTLNSIKWMAEIQKSRGIVEMAGSLAILLKHVAKGTDEILPLAQELDLVREFCTIQDYRTGGLAQLKVVLEDPELERAAMLKFTLQPLVENALQHGIEPTGRPGTIVIHAHRDGADLVVDVTDDGVGIEPARAAVLLEEEPADHGRSFNPIGLKNVDERIKLRFGPGHGLTIRGEPGVFTTVSVRLPLEIHGILLTGSDDAHRSDRR